MGRGQGTREYYEIADRHTPLEEYLPVNSIEHLFCYVFFFCVCFSQFCSVFCPFF